MTEWKDFSNEFRDRLKEEAPEYIFDFWFERDASSLICDKYGLKADWQIKAYNDIQRDIFLKDISLITLASEIKNRLKIKDDNIAKSIALDTAIHILSVAKDYFKGTDNLIKSLGGEDAYWKKYSPSYWDEKIEAIPVVSLEDIKIARRYVVDSISKAEFELKNLEKNDAENLVPTLYKEITAGLKYVKAQVDSEDYGLILNLDKSARGLIKEINKAMEATLSEKRKRQEIIEEREKNGLCITCGIKLGVFDKIRGKTKCANHNK